MSGYLNDTAFAAANFELVDVYDRLNKSAEEGEKETQRRRANVLPTDNKHKQYSSPAIEHAVISECAKNGIWQSLPFVRVAGGDNFSKDLDRVIDTRHPEQIRVVIYNGLKGTIVEYDKIITIVDPNEKRDNENEFSGFEGSFDQLKSSVSSGDPNDLKYQLMNLEMKFNNMNAKHEIKVNEINMNNRFEKQRLQDRINALEQELNEYKNEDEEDDDEGLSGIEDNSLLGHLKEFGAGILSKAGQKLIENNPHILNGLGWSGNKEDKNVKEVEKPNNQTEASFAEASPGTVIDFSGVDPEQAKDIEGLVLIFLNLSKTKFKKFYSVISALYNEKARDIREDLIDEASKHIAFTVAKKQSK